MLSTLSGGSLLPREVIQWLDSLDLSYSVRNPKMDLSNGFTIAQILTRKYPNELSILTFYNAQAKDKKYNNWEQLKKLSWYSQSGSHDTFFSYALKIIQFCKKRNSRCQSKRQIRLSTLNHKQPSRCYLEYTNQSQVANQTLIADQARPYHNHNNLCIRNQQPVTLRRTDNLTVSSTTISVNSHQNHIHTQKYNTGLIQWLIQKRKTEIHKEVERQREELEKKTRKLMTNEQKIQVKEIELKCFNSSTSKKNKGEYGDFVDNKGVVQFLTESCSLLFKRQNVANDLKKLGIQIRQKQISTLNIIEDVLNKADQLDSKGNTKLSSQTLNRILEQFKKTSQLNLIMENINSNFLDYKKFFNLFEKSLIFYNKETQTFKLIINLLTIIAKGLHQKFSSQNAEMMFFQHFFETLLKVGQNQNKRHVISNLILDFVRKQSQSYSRVLQHLKIYANGNIRLLSSYLALFLDKISKQCQQIQYPLWSEFFYYGFLAIHNTSPHTRVNGTKIISKLFSDIIIVNNEMINQKIQILQNLIVDPWWQVKAQALIIFKAILMSKFKNLSSSEQNINEDLNFVTIRHYILEIFKQDVSHNILRIGLIQLAQLLMFENSFCERYLEILLHVGVQIRTDVLTTSIIKFGPVVYGSNTYNYQLTGAPLVWNALGIAQELNKYIKKNNVSVFQLSHLEILFACVSKNDHISQNSSQWLSLYQQLKSKIFESFLDQQLCSIALSIIRQLLSVKQIHSDILKASSGEIRALLNKVYCQNSISQKIKANILELLSFLKTQQSEYTYKILKDFAEREKSKYLESNLIQFMNQLSRERRKAIFSE